MENKSVHLIRVQQPPQIKLCEFHPEIKIQSSAEVQSDRLVFLLKNASMILRTATPNLVVSHSAVTHGVLFVYPDGILQKSYKFTRITTCPTRAVHY